MKADRLIIYKISDADNGQILRDVSFLIKHFRQCRESEEKREEYENLLHGICSELIKYADERGLSGNLWHAYLVDYLVNHENAYSMGCEIRGEVQGSVNEFALHDFYIMKEFLEYDFDEMLRELNTTMLGGLFEYKRAEGSEGKTYNHVIRDRILELAESLPDNKTPEEMKRLITEFYKDYGVGKFGLHKAFRVEDSGDKALITPILNIKKVSLDDLIGYEQAKKKLIDNTESFIRKKPANNCLLFGDAGTGKSTSIKGILNKYYDKGLRIIEIYKHQFRALNDVIAQIKDRNYRFIIYMDDLSFEEFEIEYKYLKAVIEGGLEKTPDNVLIYATSNRRHLIRETFRDKSDRIDDEDMHSNDTVQEKLSLVARFGVTVYYGSPAKKEFDEIVLALAKREGIMMTDDEIILKANQWELSHGGRSGRCAQQFIDHLKGISENGG